MGFILNIWGKLKGLIALSPPAQFKTRMSAVSPSHDSIQPNVITIVGTPTFHKWAYFRCPCGCNGIVTLSLSKNRRPRWSVSTNRYGAPTIHPSIWETDGCFSHYWIKDGNVTWCKDSGRRHFPDRPHETELSC